MVKSISGVPLFAMLFACQPFLNCRAPETPPVTPSASCARTPHLDPDYSGIVFPPNIAPLNFVIKEPGRRFFVALHSQEGVPILRMSRKASIAFSQKQWHALLDRNKGNRLQIDIYVENPGGVWSKFAPVFDTIAPEKIDRYCMYRLIPPLYGSWGEMGVYLRDLSTFEEKPLWKNRMSEKNCMNCHTFSRNDPDYAVFHMRMGAGNGTLIRQKDVLYKVNTATPLTNKAGGYPAWHPDGIIIAFSVNNIVQFFHAIGNTREGFDSKSDIIIYNTLSNTMSRPAKIASPLFMETQPAWSADGNYLFFCRAPLISGIDTLYRGGYKAIKYDLMKIRYYAPEDTWGEPECVVSSQTTGLSCSFPRESPDGRWLLFCMAPWGTFPIFRPGGDLYLLNCATGNYYKPAISSDMPEGFHDWSGNSRWILFSSKRRDGICAQPYFSYVDSNGTAHKPFVMPQKNPDFYNSFLMTFNYPELLNRPFDITPQKLIRIARDTRKVRQPVPDARSLPAAPNPSGNNPPASDRE